jgi:hypothetical protein
MAANLRLARGGVPAHVFLLAGIFEIQSRVPDTELATMSEVFYVYMRHRL